jgi:hypothetical protein
MANIDEYAIKQMLDEVNTELEDYLGWRATSLSGEAQELYLIGREYNNRFVENGFDLMAHGNERGGLKGLLTILTEGRLVHSIGTESYGSLGIKFNGYCGHLDSGEGLFVGESGNIRREIRDSAGEGYFVVPLETFDAVVVPTPLAEILGGRFPKIRIKGYKEYARHLDNMCKIFDYFERKNFRLEQKGFE